MLEVHQLSPNKDTLLPHHSFPSQVSESLRAPSAPAPCRNKLVLVEPEVQRVGSSVDLTTIRTGLDG